jgi:tRNA G18 (ribose-2'-O)-methylase SpoU
MRGYCAIGIENCKDEKNIGTLFRTAYIFGANYIFTINKRYTGQCSDTPKSWRHMPLFNYPTFEDFYNHMPYDCRLVGVELDDRAEWLKSFVHPERCIYLLGAEDHGLTKKALSKCHYLIKIPGSISLNVSVAGSIVLYDRISKATGGEK